jgi:hypothetical protein
LPSSRFGNSASNGSIIAHCSSVNSSPRAMNKILARAIYETSSSSDSFICRCSPVKFSCNDFCYFGYCVVKCLMNSFRIV